MIGFLGRNVHKPEIRTYQASESRTWCLKQKHINIKLTDCCTESETPLWHSVSAYVTASILKLHVIVNPTALCCWRWSLWIWEETTVQLTSAHYLIWICENSIEAPRRCLLSVHFPLYSCFENHSVSFGLICADEARLKAWSEVSPHRVISASFRISNWTEFFWESTVYIVLVDYRHTWVYFSVRQVVELTLHLLCMVKETWIKNVTPNQDRL